MLNPNHHALFLYFSVFDTGLAVYMTRVTPVLFAF